MSLIVTACRRDAEGKWQDLPGLSSDLFGFERWRQEIFGSAIARDIGIELLAQLAQHDLLVEGDDLVRLRHEAETLLFAADRFGEYAERLRIRLNNLRAAIDLAEAAGGAVSIS